MIFLAVNTAIWPKGMDGSEYPMLWRMLMLIVLLISEGTVQHTPRYLRGKVLRCQP